MSTSTTCPYCGVGCGVLATRDGTIKGDPDHPSNFGRLCSKGAALGETLGLEGRLLAPQIAGRKTGWDAALDLVAKKFTDAISDHGPNSVAFYVSGQFLTEDYYVANKLMKGYIGSANIDTNSRLCMASSVAGHIRAFGTDTVPGTYEDLEQADLIVLVGSNLAWCHPVLYQRIAAAKEARPELTVVNIDPRRTATTQLADLHLQIAPDGDIALFNGLLSYLVDTQMIDLAYVHDHVSNCRDAVLAARATDPLGSGLRAQDLRTFYRLWAGTEKVVTVFSQGVNQSRCGTDKVNAILNCHLVTGRIGKPGMGPFSVTGQPNAMGGREVGGLANMLACHLDIANPDHRMAVQNAWQSPTICTRPGLKAVDLFQACADGRIKALWIMSTNPAVSMPDADGVARAIANVPFTVVTDIMARTDTGDLAGVLLPAAGWGEKSGTVTNSERRISRQRAFLPAPGMARPDWDIISDVARRMGFQGFEYDSPAAIFREYARLTELSVTFGKDLDLTGLSDLSDDGYETLAPVQWPVPRDGMARGRFFGNGQYFHTGGKARMIPTVPPQVETRDGFLLNTGRIRDQWHTMTRTGKSPRLSRHLAEPYIEIHPLDAADIGVGPADLIQLSSSHGRGVFRALIADKAQRGQLFAPMHWTRQRSSAGWVNASVLCGRDPVSGQPALKSAVVQAKRFAAAWYGFAASAAPMQPNRPYAAVSLTDTGSRGEVAGIKPPPDWEAEARAITAISDGTISTLHDAGSGLVRVAITVNDRIAALFFASPRPVALNRDAVVALIGTDTPPLQALAGRSGSGRADAGAVICSCFSVGINTLREALAAGATSVEALGAVTCAGTNCGSCKPELAALLSVARLPMAAE
ncbi:MAG: molybdopterin-dependent oxidoreductase [Rhodobacter sp.]|nr:molybdopterin-dependent oxidoreductase [Rhodobacter sp.]